MLSRSTWLGGVSDIKQRKRGKKMLNKFRDEIHKNALEHGWWKDGRTFGDIVALCHSELSEALEEYRDGRPHLYFSGQDENGCRVVASESCPPIITKPEGIAIELADCIIRILDYCGKVGIDVDGAIRLKHEYNKGRPYKHGGKVI